ncbi:TPA: 2Fe-2S iron-sulfur cluster binding domain-containing protein, partial [Candidatus Bipolaricaulota bacterium]|nr:2Fe-2S iron-sulfur cluster binding domain-containing protein [Candidatus Bipolaricaulota bacterium]
MRLRTLRGQREMREVTLTIDGQTVRVPPGATILEAASSLGIEIPQLCYLEGLSPFSGCRLCLVEVEGARTLVPACSHPVKEGIIVRTTSERVLHARRLVLELLLSDHPQDCLTCERNGACKLQDYAYQYGLSTIRFAGERHHYPLDERNPFIIIDYNKCILCGRCVRICEEVQGRAVIDFSYRGFATKVTTPFERPLTETNCEFCGQCVAVCPTGALTEKARRFKGREWELRKVTTVCPFCGVGCQLDLNIKDGKVVRVTSTQGAVNGRNLCVKGRFGFEFIHREDRLKRPLVRRGEGSVEVSWDEALDLIARRLTEIKERYGPDAIAGLSSAKCTNEEN